VLRCGRWFVDLLPFCLGGSALLWYLPRVDCGGDGGLVVVVVLRYFVSLSL